MRLRRADNGCPIFRGGLPSRHPVLESLEDRVLLTVDLGAAATPQGHDPLAELAGFTVDELTRLAGISDAEAERWLRLIEMQSTRPEAAEPSEATATELEDRVTSPLVQYRVIITDFDRNPLQEVQIGDEFVVRVFVSDLRHELSTSRGVFAAYTRLQFEGQGIELIGDVSIGDSFPNVRRTPDEVHQGLDRVGGVGGLLSSESPAETLLFEMLARATQVGSTAIRTGPVDVDFQGAETLLYGTNSAVPTEAIDFGATQLSVVPQPPPTESVARPVTDPPVLTPVGPAIPPSPKIDIPEIPDNQESEDFDERPAGLPTSFVSFRSTVRLSDPPREFSREIPELDKNLTPESRPLEQFEGSEDFGDTDSTESRDRQGALDDSPAETESPIDQLLQLLGDSENPFQDEEFDLSHRGRIYGRSPLRRMYLNLLDNSHARDEAAMSSSFVDLAPPSKDTWGESVDALYRQQASEVESAEQSGRRSHGQSAQRIATYHRARLGSLPFLVRDGYGEIDRPMPVRIADDGVLAPWPPPERWAAQRWDAWDAVEPVLPRTDLVESGKAQQSGTGLLAMVQLAMQLAASTAVLLPAALVTVSAGLWVCVKRPEDARSRRAAAASRENSEEIP